MPPTPHSAMLSRQISIYCMVEGACIHTQLCPTSSLCSCTCPQLTQTGSSDPPPPPAQDGESGEGRGAALEMVYSQKKRELLMDEFSRTWGLFSQDEDETEKHRACIVLTSNLLFFVISSVFLSLWINLPTLSQRLPFPAVRSRQSYYSSGWVQRKKGSVFLFLFNFLPSPLPRALTCRCQGANKSSAQWFKFSKKYIHRHSDILFCFSVRLKSKSIAGPNFKAEGESGYHSSTSFWKGNYCLNQILGEFIVY